MTGREEILSIFRSSCYHEQLKREEKLSEAPLKGPGGNLSAGGVHIVKRNPYKAEMNFFYPNDETILCFQSISAKK